MPVAPAATVAQVSIAAPPAQEPAATAIEAPSLYKEDLPTLPKKSRNKKTLNVV